jgi:hypothetical protein
MEVRGQLHAPDRFTLEERTTDTHWIGDWVNPRTGLDDVERRKMLPLGRPAHSQSIYRLRYCTRCDNRWMMNWKGSERKLPWHDRGSSPKFVGGIEGKQEFQTWWPCPGRDSKNKHLQNINEGHSLQTNLFCQYIRRGADKSSVFPVSYFPICSTTKRIFLGWVKEVRTKKS